MELTKELVEGLIAAEYWTTGDSAFEDCPEHQSLKLLTICVLVLHNGFTVTGTSSCIDPEKFDKELGHKVARAKAIQQVTELAAYVLLGKGSFNG